MVKPNFIPRTLIGANGARLFDIPGVYYPPEMLAQSSASAGGGGKILRKPPPNYITTAAAAKLLRCSCSNARHVLHRAGVPCRFVKTRFSKELYWSKKHVLRHRDAAPPIADAFPSGYVSTREALSLLGCARSCLQSLSRRGCVRECKIRSVRPTRGGSVRSGFCLSDIEKIAPILAENRRLRQALAAGSRALVTAQRV